MKKEKKSLSVDVVNVTDKSLHKRFNMPRGEGKSEQHVLDIASDTHNLPSASSDGRSMSYGSPFAPNKRGIKGFLESKRSKSSTSRSHNTHALGKRALWELEKKKAPEKILIFFAVRLALLEKIATTVGKLCFIWATVVLLGGYASTLKPPDFWCVTLILITEGARIFSRSHELEWQHQNPGKSTISQKVSGAIHKSARAIQTVLSPLITPGGSQQSRHPHEDASGYLHPVHLGRAWASSEVFLVPFMWMIFKGGRVSAILDFMQILSATLSIGISVWRLFQYDGMDESLNHNGALIMFYSLTVFETLVFLIERAYYHYKLSVENILDTVNNSCRLELDEDCYTVRRFFFDVCAKCLSESVFEGLKMDLVAYSLQWLESDMHVEQLHGVRALFAFSCNPESSQETLRTIGTHQGAVERLLEMVTWKNEEKRDIREEAANLLGKVVGYDRTGIRVAAITGSVEAIFSLLTDDRIEGPQSWHAQEYTRTEIVNKLDESPRAANHIVQTGLKVLINMAKNTINCARIGSTRGLLARLISFIGAHNEIQKGHEETVWFLSLELLSLLAACPGVSGKILKQDIANNLVSITNLRNILNSKEGGYRLQELAAGTLSSLAMDAQVREVIGRTGGVMHSLFSLFLTDAKGKEEEMKVAIKAGEALMLLSLEDSNNCARMVRLRLQADQEELIEASGNNMDASRSVGVCQSKDVVDALVELMGDRHRGHLAIFMLLCFCDNNVELIHKMRIAAATSQVMRIAMGEKEDERARGSAIGLAARTLPLLRAEEVERLFSSGEFTKEDVVMMLVRKLEAHPEPYIGLPWVRRVCLRLVAALLDCDLACFWGLFAMSKRFVACLHNVAATSSEVENYVTFSGPIGVSFSLLTMEDLTQTVIDKLQLQH